MTVPATRPRRRIGRVAAACGVLAATLIGTSCETDPVRSTGKRLIVLGFDGMDYTLAQRYLEDGKLPNLAHLAAAGGFSPLETSIPPQSPVAWSDFITGLDAGGHGIFDFIHRDPSTMLPYLSTSRVDEGGRTLRLGSWQIPLSRGGVTLLRRGVPFWR